MRGVLIDSLPESPLPAPGCGSGAHRRGTSRTRGLRLRRWLVAAAVLCLGIVGSAQAAEPIVFLGIQRSAGYDKLASSLVSESLHDRGELVLKDAPITAADRRCRRNQCLEALATQNQATLVLSADVTAVGPNQKLRVQVHIFDVRLAGRPEAQFDHENLCAECDETKLEIMLTTTASEALDRYRQSAAAVVLPLASGVPSSPTVTPPRPPTPPVTTPAPKPVAAPVVKPPAPPAPPAPKPIPATVEAILKPNAPTLVKPPVAAPPPPPSRPLPVMTEPTQAPPVVAEPQQPMVIPTPQEPTGTLPSLSPGESPPVPPVPPTYAVPQQQPWPPAVAPLPPVPSSPALMAQGLAPPDKPKPRRGLSPARKAVAAVFGVAGFSALAVAAVLTGLDRRLDPSYQYNPQGAACEKPENAGKACVVSTLGAYAPNYAIGGLLVGGMILTLALPESK